MRSARDRLVRLLQRAHAGELAAYHAYEGHWRAVRSPAERDAIARFAAEELAHRAELFALLTALGAAPAPWRERLLLAIGRGIRVACRVLGWTGSLGWYACMDGAGRLEASNVHEYVLAAEHARDAGLPDAVPGLLRLARVEWDHEAYFHARCASHGLARIAPGWRRPAPPPPHVDASPAPGPTPTAPGTAGEAPAVRAAAQGVAPREEPPPAPTEAG